VLAPEERHGVELLSASEHVEHGNRRAFAVCARDPNAAALAWRRTMDFFAKHLK
jgi:hypothetical protein